MNDRDEDAFDPRLEALFRREHSHLPAEPFSSVTLAAIAAERKRAALVRRVAQLAAIVALVVLSPRLVALAAWFSMALDATFTSASSWLATPLGMAVAAFACIAAIATKWARVW